MPPTRIDPGRPTKAKSRVQVHEPANRRIMKLERPAVSIKLIPHNHNAKLVVEPSSFREHMLMLMDGS